MMMNCTSETNPENTGNMESLKLGESGLHPVGFRRRTWALEIYLAIRSFLRDPVQGSQQLQQLQGKWSKKHQKKV